jgi:kynureninase
MSRAPAFDFLALRQRFPVMRERAYFATQCMGPFPDEMLADLDEYRRSLFLRSRAIPGWVERVDDMMALLEGLLGAPRHAVALMPNATASQAAIVAALDPADGRDRILYTSIDFHSSRYLWAAQARRGFRPIEVPSTDGSMPTAALADQIDQRTALVSLALVSPQTGALADVRPVVEAARAAGALVVVDAYQAVGSMPLDVGQLGVDVLVAGTHKWLGGGGMGLTFLYVRPAVSERLAAAYPGWVGHREMVGFAETYEPGEGARRFMQGTPALEPIYSARAGLRYVLETGLPAIRARSLSLSALLIERAQARGLTVNTPVDPKARGGLICLDVPDAEHLVEPLAAEGIDVDWRPRAGLRLSAHPCNTEQECERAIDAIARLAGRTGRTSR